ncbi:MAG: hypothetical protein RLY87_2295 [Chloroflexota bacterium]|jgi:DUF4097 and DUF4098 domain-containing protein YvlB
MNILDKILGRSDAPPVNPALTYQTAGMIEADLKTAGGDVHVHTHTSQTILVTFSELRSDAGLAPEGPGWSFDSVNGVLRIDTHAMQSRDLKRSDIDLFVPEGSAITLTTAGGDGTFVGQFKSLRVTSMGGDIDTSDAQCPTCFLTSAGGDIEAVIAGEGDVQTAGGDIELSITAQSTVRAHSAGGDISIDVHAPCVITATTMAGDIEVSVDRGYETEVDAATTVGEINSDIAFHAAGDGSEPADVRLTLKTTAGDIEIRQR